MRFFCFLIVCFAGMFGGTGCAHRINWTERFERNPELMERCPGLGALRLGALYETQRDMVLIGSPPRGYYALGRFGGGGFPSSVADYESGRRMLKIVHGIVKAGALIRAHRVAAWYDLGSGQGWAGIVYRIETEPHEGVLLSPTAFVIRGSIDNPFGFVINPETMKLVEEGGLDSAGKPLPKGAPPAEYEGIGVVPRHLLKGRYLLTPYRGIEGTDFIED